MCTPSPKRSTTITCSIVGVSAIAASTWCLRPTFLPRRQPPSAVISTFAPQSLMRPDERLRGEPAEDHRVGRADPGAGQHRDRQLGDHRHVDRDAVALADAQLEQRVGRLGALAHQVRVRQRAGVAGLADPVVGHLVAEAALDVAVDAVVGDVELAAREPLRVREVPLQGLVVGREPRQPLPGLPVPEADVVGGGLVVQRRRGVGLGGEDGVGRKRPLLGRRFSISGPSWAWGSTVTGPSGSTRGSGHSTRPPGRHRRSNPESGADGCRP